MNWRANKNRLYVLIYTIYVLDELFLLRTNIADLLTETGVSVLSMACKAAICGMLAIYVTQFMRVSRRQAVVLAGLLGAFMLSSCINHTTTMTQMLILVVCFADADLDRIVRRCVQLMAVIGAVTVLLAVAGLITNRMKERQAMSVMRLSYGFHHPNTLAQLGFQISTGYLYLKRRWRSAVKFLVPLAVTMVCFFTSYSLTGVGIGLMMIAAAFAAECIESGGKMSHRVLYVALIVALAVILAVIIHFWNNPRLFGEQLLSMRARFSYSKRYIRAYGIHLLGRRLALGAQVMLPGSNKLIYGYLDNGYVRILLESGALVFACFMAAQLEYLRRLARRRETLMCIIQVCYMVYGFMEYKAFSVMFNVFLLNIGMQLLRAPKAAPPPSLARAPGAAANGR